MSTKKKLIESTYFTRQGIYEGANYTHDLVGVRHLLDLLERKQNTEVTKELLLGNGFVFSKHGTNLSWTGEDGESITYYIVGKEIVVMGEWRYTRLTLPCSVSELEDAIDLCKITKDIEV